MTFGSKTPLRLPDVQYLVASGLVGFIVGAFVVATLGDMAWRRITIRKAPSPISAGVLDDGHAAVLEKPAATSGQAEAVPASVDGRELADRDLEIPVQGIKRDQLVRSFHDDRGSDREHEAIDILAPRNGTIARLFLSKAGGNTIYQFDPGQEYCYYYAHLERYADGLREGDHVNRGEVIGYVGTSGNAPKNTPHLHFAVFKLTSEKHWWEGTALDPYDVLR
jgi:murein DD-endopeptidase MepM/ murein hydrolase activator NlpD